MLVKNENFLQKSKFEPTKSKLWPKIKILAKTQNVSQNSKCCPKINVLSKNNFFVQKSKLWPKNQNFGQKSKFWLKIKMLATNLSLFATKTSNLPIALCSLSGFLIGRSFVKKRFSNFLSRHENMIINIVRFFHCRFLNTTTNKETTTTTKWRSFGARN